MVNTYNFLKTTLTRAEQFKQMTDVDLCKLYQTTKDSEIITYEFCKHIKFFLKLANKFSNITSLEDIPSLVLIALERALTTFNFDKNVAFNSYAGTVVFRELENKIYFSARRNINSVSLEETICSDTEDITYADIVEDTKSSFGDFEICDYLAKASLKEDELELCKLLIQSDSKISNKELSETLNKHRHTIRNIKLSLKNKLAGLKDLQTYSR